MGFFGSSPKLTGYSLPPPAAHPPTMSSTNVLLAGLEARQRARANEGAGFDNTIKTTPQGTTVSSNRAPSTLLGA